jgi:hypothetical protein
VTVAGSVIEIEASCERRRLNEVNSTNYDFTYVSGAENTIRFEPCSDSDVFDTVVVQRSDGAYIGQLLGDGIGVDSDSGTIGTIDFCMNSRLDFNVRDDIFDTIALGVLDTTASSSTVGGRVVRLVDNAVYQSRSLSRVCVSVTQVGTYFPIIVANVSNSVNCDSTGCVSGQSRCILNKDASAECLCQCGFSGTTCNVGCPYSCNNQGTCANNICQCNTDSNGNPIYTLNDCSKINCPANNATGVTCSGQGSCSYDNTTNAAVCTCQNGYSGNDCSVVPETGTNGVNTGGYAGSLTSDDQDASSGSFGTLGMIASGNHSSSNDDNSGDDNNSGSSSWFHQFSSKNCRFPKNPSREGYGVQLITVEVKSEQNELNALVKAPSSTTNFDMRIKFTKSGFDKSMVRGNADKNAVRSYRQQYIDIKTQTMSASSISTANAASATGISEATLTNEYPLANGESYFVLEGAGVAQGTDYSMYMRVRTEISIESSNGSPLVNACEKHLLSS